MWADFFWIWRTHVRTFRAVLYRAAIMMLLCPGTTLAWVANLRDTRTVTVPILINDLIKDLIVRYFLLCFVAYAKDTFPPEFQHPIPITKTRSGMQVGIGAICTTSAMMMISWLLILDVGLKSCTLDCVCVLSGARGLWRKTEREESQLPLAPLRRYSWFHILGRIEFC